MAGESSAAAVAVDDDTAVETGARQGRDDDGLDLRFLPGPGTFSGETKGTEWKEFSFKTVAYLSCQHAKMADLLTEASRFHEPIVLAPDPPINNKLSRMLYLYSAVQTKGKT